MEKWILTISLITCLCACQHPSKTTVTHTVDMYAILDTIAANAQADLNDITLQNHTPTDRILITTRYPLSGHEIRALEKAEKMEGSHATLYSIDNATCIWKQYALSNEKGEKLHIINDKEPVYIQRFGLWEYDGILCQNLGINIKLDGRFTLLKGSITMQLQLSESIQKEVILPVHLSISEK